jgi:hypothetical protein
MSHEFIEESVQIKAATGKYKELDNTVNTLEDWRNNCKFAPKIL